MNQYGPVLRVFKVYWRIYGGAPALYKSPYFHVSLAVAILCAPLWWDSQEWATLALGCIPNILGFSIGAFAVILSFGQSSLELLKDKDESRSRYMGVVSSFVHFIVVQSSSLIIALIGKAYQNAILGLIGTILFVYAISLAVAAAMRLFRLARIYNQIESDEPSPESERPSVQKV